jgi:DNA invertase Pin-like site-specific DNA recombinase
VRSEERSRNDDGAKDLRAAQYVRVSTDHQKYSIENQAAAIAAYAAHRNITIVRTYADHGRSGVRIDGREELQRLIKDVRNRQTDFTLILVYDISRWGRFQDADEAAYYEFLCKEAGIQVLYCAEQFENDGSLVSAILKNMKRVMAGEYSRDLSTKVSTGQMRGASLGFWQGGPAGYGMRRQLIDEYGTKKAVLENGQQKSFKADRTILVPGPKSEINVVKRIFELFVNKRKTRTEIAAQLNARKIYNARGRLWTSLTIDNILKNEKYIGHNIFGRGSIKLGGKHVRNPPETWVRRENAFAPIVAPKLFAKAQRIRKERLHRSTDQEVLDKLAGLLRKKGHLSEKIVTASKETPHASIYANRFGSLMAAYKRVGFDPGPRFHYCDSRNRIETIIDAVVEDVISNIEGLGGSATYLSELHLLTINTKLTISIGVATCVSDGAPRPPRWQLRRLKYEKADLSLIIRMDQSNSGILSYYLLPTGHLPPKQNYRSRFSKRVFSEAYRHDNLNALYRMWTRDVPQPKRKSPVRHPARTVAG